MKTKTVPVFDYSRPMMNRRSHSYKTRMPLPQYQHPITGIIQDYSDWIDEGYDYDLVGAGFIAVGAPTNSTMPEHEIMKWLRA